MNYKYDFILLPLLLGFFAVRKESFILLRIMTSVIARCLRAGKPAGYITIPVSNHISTDSSFAWNLDCFIVLLKSAGRLSLAIGFQVFAMTESRIMYIQFNTNTIQILEKIKVKMQKA